MFQGGHNKDPAKESTSGQSGRERQSAPTGQLEDEASRIAHRVAPLPLLRLGAGAGASSGGPDEALARQVEAETGVPTEGTRVESRATRGLGKTTREGVVLDPLVSRLGAGVQRHILAHELVHAAQFSDDADARVGRASGGLKLYLCGGADEDSEPAPRSAEPERRPEPAPTPEPEPEPEPPAPAFTPFPATADTATPAEQLVLTQFRTAYTTAATGATPSDAAVPDDVERQRAGFDAMAELLEEHAADDGWLLSQLPEVMRVLHTIGYWEDFGRRASAVAQREYRGWTAEGSSWGEEDDPNRDPGPLQYSETAGQTNSSLRARLRAYWSSIPEGNRRGERTVAEHVEGSTRDAPPDPWSAAFVSYVMRQAGAGDTFRYDTSHLYYLRAARGNAGENATTHPSRLLEQSVDNTGPNQPVRVGDLLHRRRAASPEDLSLSTVPDSAQVATHADLVVAIETIGDRRYAVTIGGNTVDQRVVDGEVRIRHREGEDEEFADHEQGTDLRNETVGRRYWPLRSDGAIDNTALDTELRIYAIQRYVAPPAETPSEE